MVTIIMTKTDHLMTLITMVSIAIFMIVIYSLVA